MCAKGVAKLIEECGELQQVLGPRLAMWDQEEHWDGSNLVDRMVEEMGDVIAAIDFVAFMFGVVDQTYDRAGTKRALFEKWEAEDHNNAHGIDGSSPEASD
jgi:hypothetical protein